MYTDRQANDSKILVNAGYIHFGIRVKRIQYWVDLIMAGVKC